MIVFKNIKLYLSWLFCTACLLVSCEKTNTYFADFHPTTDQYEGDIFSYLESKPGVYDSLVFILDRLPDVKDSLRAEGARTLFAANNRSIEIALSSLNSVRKQSNKEPLYIEDLKLSELDSIVNRYIFNGEITTESIRQLSDGQFVDAIKYGYRMHVQYNGTSATGLVNFGPQEIVFSDTNRSLFHFDWVRTSTASINIKTKNGVVHMLTPGHDFGFNKFITAFN